MYYNDQVTNYLQANRILALKLDHAVTAVRRQVADQIETLGAGAQRLTYYTSCFTDDYQDICQQQKTEDIRFTKAVEHLLQQGGVVYDMLKIYFEEIFKYKTSAQLESIKKMLMAVNIHIAASSLTTAGFSLAVATSVSLGMNLSLEISALTGRTAGTVVGVMTMYGVVQKAADSAQHLRIAYPAYYAALYAQGLEMMYFLIEPTFKRAGAFKAQGASNSDIAEIINRMIR